MKELIGYMIERVHISPNQHEMLFVVRGNKGLKYLSYPVEGNCCSESWYSDIYGCNILRNGLVEEVEKLELPGYTKIDDGRCRQDVDRVYGVRITIRGKGIVVIAFRNSSNGYYGGELCDPVEYPMVPDGFEEIDLYAAEWSA